MDLDRRFMEAALKEAKKAGDMGEVPVGCVIVLDGKIISRGYNRTEGRKDPMAHAEIIAIRKAAKSIGSWRLTGCTMYVTLEPCPMCAGAVMNSRIKRVVYGAPDPKGGAFGSMYDLSRGGLNHTAEVTGGVMAGECSDIIKEFFRAARTREPFRKNGPDSISK